MANDSRYFSKENSLPSLEIMQRRMNNLANAVLSAPKGQELNVFKRECNLDISYDFQHHRAELGAELGWVCSKIVQADSDIEDSIKYLEGVRKNQGPFLMEIINWVYGEMGY